MVDIDDVPEHKATPPLRYSKRITFPVEGGDYEKIDLLKNRLNKNISELMRMLLKEFLSNIDWSQGA